MRYRWDRIVGRVPHLLDFQELGIREKVIDTFADMVKTCVKVNHGGQPLKLEVPYSCDKSLQSCFGRQIAFLLWYLQLGDDSLDIFAADLDSSS